MIIRILEEGQYEVPEDIVEGLNPLDDEVQAAVDSGEMEAFGPALQRLLAEVRRHGTRLPDDHLEPSELVLPPADATLDEVRAMLGSEGLIPG